MPHRRHTAAAGRAELRPAKPPVPRRFNRLTLEGGLFIGLSFLIGMASVNSGHNLLYLVFSVMLAMLLLSGNLARINLSGLRLQRRYPLEFHCDQDVSVSIEVHNTKRVFSSYLLRVQDYLIAENPMPARQNIYPCLSFATMVRSGQTVRCPPTLHIPQRGLPVGLVSIVFSVSFRLLSARAADRQWRSGVGLSASGSAACAVGISGFAAGDGDADRKGHGVNLFGIRNYQAGDPARHIHWKHSAKGLGLKLKEFEEERMRSFRLVLDLRCADPADSAMAADFEKAVSVAATLARHLIGGQHSVALWTTFGRVAPGFGRVQLQRIMRALALLTPQRWDVEIPLFDAAQPDTASFMIAFQDYGALPPEADRSFRISPDMRVIDVRKLRLTESDTDYGGG